MATAEKRETVNTLNRLIRLCNASEKGFGVAAENVKNRGLKVMFKTYAHERAKWAESWREDVEELGGEPAEGGGILAAAHRGWINIKSAMTIGQFSTEKVVLGEVVRGEHVAERRFEDALQQSLPDDVRSGVQERYERVCEVSDRVQELAGREGRRLVVRLFDTEEDVAEAETELADAGFDPDSIERVPFSEVLAVYEGRGGSGATAESALAGALIGAGLGVLLGLIAGASTMIAPGEPLFSMGLGELFLWTTLGGTVAGLIFGALIGAIIGQGVSQEDEYRYAESVDRGSIVLCVRTDVSRAAQASDLMREVNARRWRVAT